VPPNDPAVRREILKRYRMKNADKLAAKFKIYRENNRSKVKEKWDRERVVYAEKRRFSQRLRSNLTPFEKEVRFDLFKFKQLQTRRDNAVKEASGRWGEFANQLSPNERKIWGNYYQRRRRATIPHELIAGRLRAQLCNNFKKYKIQKCAGTFELVGCSAQEFANYIESLFKDGMTWENRHRWHLDHKIPVKAFDLTKLEDQKAAFHFTNLQPMWAFDNISKGDKLPNGTRARHYKLAA
jgi:hypothetical protein